MTCLSGSTVSSGAKCGANKNNSCGPLPVCSPRRCSVTPEVSEASRSPEEVLFQGKPHTRATENASSVDPSLKLTSCVFQNLVVDLLLLIPFLVPSLLWCMGSVWRFLVNLVTP